MDVTQLVEQEKCRAGWLSRLNRMNFIFLIPLAAKALSSGDDALTADDFKADVVGNTVVAELPEGTAYAYLAPDGTNAGLHPTEGRVSGRWKVDDEGVVCVTWPTIDIENCSAVVATDENKFSWADRTLEVQPGDTKGLAN